MKYIINALTIATVALLISCKSHKPSTESEQQTFVLSDTMLKTTTFSKATLEPIRNELEFYGKIAADNNKLIEIYPMVGGSVMQVFVELGDYVQKGQLLATIRSTEVAGFEKDLNDALNDVVVAKNNLKTAQELFEGKLNTERDVITAKSELDKAQSNLSRIQETYKIYSLKPGAVYEVRSPISGFILEKNINQDMLLRNDHTNNIFDIAQIDEVWALANVTETDIHEVELGFDAEITTLSYPDKVFYGKIDKIFNIIDPETKAMKVRIKLKNPEFLLKPEMKATVKISYKQKDKMISIPSSAIIFDKSQYYVMVYKDKFNIETRKVEVFRQLEDVTYISSGLQSGESVITHNQLLIYDASNDQPMNKFIKNIIAFSIKNRMFTFFWVSVLVIAGVIAFRQMPIEAFPDVTNTQIIIVTQWNGRSAEEVERFVTSPIEIAMNSVQRKINVRSITMFGLSVIKINFEDDVEDFFARQQVNNQLHSIQLPDGVEPDVQPPYGPTGEVFRYVLKSDKRDTRDLLTLQTWVIDRQLRSIPGVADLVAFGGQQKVYEVSIDPNRLSGYDITPMDVYDAVSKSNLNVGGDIIEKNGQAFVVRGVGLLQSKKDIENIIVSYVKGNPVLVKHIAEVKEASLPRVGQSGLNNNDDVVEGIVVMRKGENTHEVLGRVKEKISELNSRILPSDVKMETFYDRDNLMDYTTHSVMHNVLEGIILVTVIVFLFMANWRTTVIVSIIVPLALLFAFLFLRFKGMTANLLSLGAIDFGIIIDGAVVMVEGLFVTLDHLRNKVGDEKFNKLAKGSIIKKNGAELGKAIFFSKLIIIMALLPIFSFEKVEGKMFSPLAWTLGFALLGALVFTLTLVPVLSHVLLNKNVREKKNPFVAFWNRIIEKAFLFTYSHKRKTLLVALGIMLLTFASAKFLGSEFMPQLNEGALWVEAKYPMSQSLSETVKRVGELRKVLLGFEEVNGVLSQTGRSNDGTDPSGFYYVQMQVNLKPRNEWKSKITYEELVDEMDKKLEHFQGITYNYSQPIIDNVAEAVAGFNADNGVKIYGDDLNKLDAIANQVVEKMKNVQGIRDLGVMRNIGQPEISVILDKEKMAAFGVMPTDAQTVLEMAFGGKTATEKYEGERKFDIRIRYSKEYRKDENDIANLKVPTLNGAKIPLKEVCTIRKITGPAFIYRDNTKRFVGVKFSVRDRDLGSTIKDAQARVSKIKLPQGYSIGWTGEFENQVRATDRLAKVVPISLIAIFVLLFIMFGNIQDATLVIANVPFALIGGILALHLTGINFGISAGVGFIALFGICIQNGVILISEFHKNIKLGFSLDNSILQGVKVRTRPVIMTALMASIGLMPAAISTGIGSESQKPLAVVIIGGLVTATILTLLVFPIIFWIFNRTKHEGIK